MVNFGVGGRKISEDVTDYTNRLAPQYDATRSRNILVYNMFGINDVGTRTSLQMQADTISILTSARSAGFKIHMSTVPPTSTISAPNKAILDDYNAWMVANWATYADAFTDICADSRIGTYNPTHYYDAAHFNELGNSVIASLISADIESLFV